MLTPKQQEALNIIEAYHKQHHRAPTMAELAQKMGIQSRGLAHRYVRDLERGGWIKRLPHRWRNIQLQQQAHARLPIMGKIAAGLPIEAIERHEDFDLVDWFLGPGRYALKVEGDSMIDEGILDGDIIVCQSAQTARSGQIVVALIDHEQATLKRIEYPDLEHVCLIPSNKSYQQQRYHASRITIQGIFVGLLRVAP